MCKEQENIIDFIVSCLFAALQTISRICGFRTKRLLELYQTLFPHPKDRKKQSGHKTIARTLEEEPGRGVYYEPGNLISETFSLNRTTEWGCEKSNKIQTEATRKCHTFYTYSWNMFVVFIGFIYQLGTGGWMLDCARCLPRAWEATISHWATPT